MTVYDTDARTAIGYAIAAMLGLLAVGLLSLYGVLVLPRTLLSFVLVLLSIVTLAAIVHMAYMLHGIAHTSYALDRNAFVIRWGARREIISMGDVQRVLNGSEIKDGLVTRRLGLPGWWVGAGRHPSLGPIRFYSTEPLENQFIVVTPEMSYGVSPYDLDAFVDAFKIRFEMGPTQAVVPALVREPFLEQDIWQDRAALGLMIAACAANLFLLGLSFGIFPQLGERISLHYNALGLPDRFGPPDAIFNLVGLGFVLLLADIGFGIYCYYRNERLIAYLLWGGGLALQLLLFVALAFTV